MGREMSKNRILRRSGDAGEKKHRKHDGRVCSFFNYTTIFLIKVTMDNEIIIMKPR